MITTVTLNPAMDRFYWIDGFHVHHLHRLASEAQVKLYPGGKGVNISLGLERLGVPTAAMGLVGGHTGRMLVGELHDRNLATNFVYAEANTRTNIFILDQTNHTLTEVGETGPVLEVDDLELILNAYELMLGGSQWIALGGSLPPGSPPDLYAHFVCEARKRNVPTLLHTGPASLAPALEAGPTVICPDLRSVHEFLGLSVDSVDDCITAGKQVLREHAAVEAALFLHRLDGVILVRREEALILRPMDAAVINPFGYGDSILAGLLASLHSGKPWETAIRFGCAAGLASLERKGKLFGTPRDIDTRIARVALDRRIDAGAAR